uniref:Uncharacterized protein n=1 Tax=Rhizophora mucronata TaxID=61149 RepID=A0A2P2MZM2_RHIMU
MTSKISLNSMMTQEKCADTPNFSTYDAFLCMQQTIS